MTTQVNLLISGYNSNASSSGVDTSSATATASDILSGKTAFAKGLKVVGTITSKAAQTYTPTTNDQTISNGVYLSGDQTIKGDLNLKAANIKNGVSIFGITGTYSGSSSTSPSLQTKTVTPTKSTQTVTPDSSYDGLSKVTVNPIPSSYIIPSGTLSITTNGTKDVSSYANVTVNVPSSGGTDTSDATAKAENIESEYTAYVNGEKIEGSITTTSAIANILANSSLYSNEGTPSFYTSSGTSSTSMPARISIKFTNNTKQIIKSNGTITASAKASLFGDATPADVASGKTFTSSSGLKLTGTASSGSSSGGLTMKTGTCTADAINTGLSSIKGFSIYKTSVTSTGFVHGTYDGESLIQYVYCSSYSTYMKSFATGSKAPTISSGTITLGLSSTSALNGTYTWIAFGEE